MSVKFGRAPKAHSISKSHGTVLAKRLVADSQRAWTIEEYRAAAQSYCRGPLVGPIGDALAAGIVITREGHLDVHPGRGTDRRGPLAVSDGVRVVRAVSNSERPVASRVDGGGLAEAGDLRSVCREGDSELIAGGESWCGGSDEFVNAGAAGSSDMIGA